MEKTNNKPVPKETVLERPALYIAMAISPTGAMEHTNGVFLALKSGKVLVKAITDRPQIRADARTVGFYRPEPPFGPRYTGPIDDEMMANILIYGG